MGLLIRLVVAVESIATALKGQGQQVAYWNDQYYQEQQKRAVDLLLRKDKEGFMMSQEDRWDAEMYKHIRDNEPKVSSVENLEKGAAC